jgi:hypothetical protein
MNGTFFSMGKGERGIIHPTLISTENDAIGNDGPKRPMDFSGQ